MKIKRSTRESKIARKIGLQFRYGKWNVEWRKNEPSINFNIGPIQPYYSNMTGCVDSYNIKNYRVNCTNSNT
jgi:hypothetical protein